jgi:transposase InsO family protein
MEKMTKRLFIQKADRPKEISSLVYTNVCGPLSTPIREGFEYFITFIDDCTRYGYVYLMTHKSDSYDKFKEFKAKVEHRIGKLIKTLRSNHGREHRISEFKDYMVHYRIVSQLSMLGIPQHNRVAERRNKTLIEIVRSMMSHVTLPISFWGYPLEITTYTLGMVPSKSVLRIPYKIWTGRSLI